METYTIRQIQPEDYADIRQLVSDAFTYNERGSDGVFHEAYMDYIRRSPYAVPELEIIAVSADTGMYLGHAVFTALPMGENAKIIWLNCLAVRHGKDDNHGAKTYEYQRRGIGTALVMRGLAIAKEMGYTGCLTCGHPDVYREKMGFKDYQAFCIRKDESVGEPDGALHAIELAPGGFDGTSKLLSFKHDEFIREDKKNEG